MGKWFCCIAAFLLALPGCGTDETPTRLNTFTPLTSIVITSAVVSLPAGVSTQLTATGNFSGIFTRDITSEVIWSSAQPLTVDFPNDFPLGRVKALVAGPATITAKTSDGITGSFNLTVNDAVITALTVAPLSPSCPLGLTKAFSAQGTFSDTTTFDLTKDVTWASSDGTVATISDEFASKGKATAKMLGETTISAQFGTFTPTSTILTVTDPILLSIAVTSANSSLLSLSSESFLATGTYSDDSTIDITNSVGWDSSNKTVATIVTGSSTVKTLTQGTTSISATLGTVKGTSVLNVTGGNLTGITLTLDQAINNVLINGTRSRVSARGTFDNGTSRDITGLIETWTVEPASIATVDLVAGNLVWVNAQAVTTTPATISAKTGAATGQSSLTVFAPTLSDVVISPLTLTLTSGTSGRLSLAGTFFPVSNQDLTSSAAWSVVSGTATVDNSDLDKGRVHAEAAGQTVVTATFGEKTATATVTVEERTLQSLTITAAAEPGAMIAGRQVRFTVMANYSTGSPQDVTADAHLTIDDSDVARFSDQQSDPGLVVAVDEGTAIVTAIFGGLSETKTLVVSP